MTHEPLVSVVIDNYNYADYLADAIDSALAQTWPFTEVIVVDDGSTDGSRAIIAAYGDRIRPVLQENGGQAAAFNAGVGAAGGDLICFLDSDDIWLPEKVERVVEAFGRFPAAAWLRHRLQVVDVTKQPQGVAVPRFRGTRLRTPVPIAFIEGRYPVPTSALAVRSGLARSIFPLPAATPAGAGSAGVDLKLDADAYIAFRAAATGAPFLSLDAELGLYRRHPHQRYVTAADVAPSLDRHILMSTGLAAVFTGILGAHVTPSSVFKHRAVLAALRGRPLLHRDRLAPALAGVRCVLPLVRTSPSLFARQTLALAMGTLAPRLWVKRLLREQGFVRSVDAK